jgi:hypothetical protein
MTYNLMTNLAFLEHLKINLEIKLREHFLIISKCSDWLFYGQFVNEVC